MELVTCPKCGGRGCPNCRSSGALAVDEASGGEFYVKPNSRGEMEVVGPKSSAAGASPANWIDLIFGFILKVTSEPRDLFWAIKVLRK